MNRIRVTFGLVISLFAMGCSSTAPGARPAPGGTGAVAEAAPAPASQPECQPTAGGSPEIVPWPSHAGGISDLLSLEAQAAGGDDLSGLTYQPASEGGQAVLWVVRNDPLCEGGSQLYRLVRNGPKWTVEDAWGKGRALRYPAGAFADGGVPDAEGITKADWNSRWVYVATERNNKVSQESRLSVLRFDTAGTGTTLKATGEWRLADLDPFLRGVNQAANRGLEAITWVPDKYLVEHHFLTDQGQPYRPSGDPGDDGIFLVGLEANGRIYGYALQEDRTAVRVATLDSGNGQIAGLEFDRDTGYLWALSDAGDAKAVVSVLAIGEDGRFHVLRRYCEPELMPAAVDNEGLAIAPESDCREGLKPVFWSDDGGSGGIRIGQIPCGRFLDSEARQEQ